MRRIFIGEKEKYNFQKSQVIHVDVHSPKSTYHDENRCDIVVSKTFRAPDEETLKKLYESSRKFFEKK